MKVLVTGAGGQLGAALCRRAPAGTTVHAAARAQLDITDAAAVEAAVAELRPDVVVNAAAYTAVDRAEQESDAARRVNAEGAAHLARACARHGARLLHVSTDYVFDGRAGSPYRVDDEPNPLNVYGRTKLEGEQAVLAAAGDRALVVRTSWLYGEAGSNFVLKMLELMRTRPEVAVVADQVGSPTWTGSLADALWRFAAEPALSGIYHWTDSGVASWYDFSLAIRDEALGLGLLPREVPVRPIGSREFPTAAARPAYSVLDKSRSWRDLGQQGPHWREALRRMLEGMRA